MITLAEKSFEWKYCHLRAGIINRRGAGEIPGDGREIKKEKKSGVSRRAGSQPVDACAACSHLLRCCCDWPHAVAAAAAINAGHVGVLFRPLSAHP